MTLLFERRGPASDASILKRHALLPLFSSVLFQSRIFCLAFYFIVTKLGKLIPPIKRSFNVRF